LGAAAFTDYDECLAAAVAGYGFPKSITSAQTIFATAFLRQTASAATTFETSSVTTYDDPSNFDARIGSLSGAFNANGDLDTLIVPAGSASVSKSIELNTEAGPQTGGFLTITFALSGGITAAAGSNTLLGTVFRIFDSGIGITAPSGETCPSTPNAALNSISLAEGGDAVFACVSLLSDPEGSAPVTVACAAGDADLTRVSPRQLASFTRANWQTPQRIRITAIDNNIAGGAASDTLTCNGSGGAGDYASATQTTPISISDADAVAAAGTLAATRSISENGGAQTVSLTAALDKIAPASACSVSISVANSLPSGAPAGSVIAVGGGTDYAGSISVPALMIAAGSLSARGAVMVQPVADADEAQEAIAFSGMAASCGGIAVNFGNAFTLIIDKSGREVLQNVNAAVLPVVTQFSAAAAMRTIAARAKAARGGAARLRLAGADSAEGALLARLRHAAAGAGAYDWRRALADSSLALPLGGRGGAAMWASGDYRGMSGDDGRVEWSGSAFSLSAGADALLANGMLAGAMLSFTDSAADYTERTLGSVNSGGYAHHSIALRPYFSRAFGETRVQGALGLARGEVELDDDSEDAARSSNTAETSLMLGVEHGLREGLRVKADVAAGSVDVDEARAGGVVLVNSQEVKSRRMRLLLAADKTYRREKGAFTRSLEVGMRHDANESSGADELAAHSGSSSGVEAAVGVDFAGGGGLNWSLNARLYSGSDYDEWGLSALAEKKPGAGGLGWSLRLRPGYGNAHSNARGMWEQSFAAGERASAPGAFAARMDGDFGYGFAAPGGRGVVTAYAKGAAAPEAAPRMLGLRWKPHARFDVDAHGRGGGAYRIGLHWVRARLLDFTLSGERNSNAGHAVLLKGMLDF
ncbi:MAG: autotransporter outer membrane beta-barrel domain-containing protein, partial [Gammaproteobacteria bacterium]